MTTASPPAAPQDEEERLKAAWGQLNLVLSFFSRIDTKLSVILGLDLGMLAMLSTLMPSVAQLSWLEGGLVAACLAPLGLSFYHMYKGSFPDTQGGSTSLVYFGRIAKMKESEFLTALRSRTCSQLCDDVLEQTWRNACILNNKFASLKRAYQMMLIAVLPWLGAIAVLSWGANSAAMSGP